MRSVRRVRNLGSWLLAATALSSGCLSFCHPIGAPPPEERTCNMLPPYCRNHVYIFFVNGIDPLCYGNLSGLRDYVQSLGFIKTYYGQFYHAGTFAKEICRLHAEDAAARFVLVGFNLGASRIHEIADAVRPSNVAIDLVVYLDGDTFATMPRSRLENVGLVVNVQSRNANEAGPLDDAVNVACPDDSFLGAPSHRSTLATLARELTTVAGRVAVVDPQVPRLERAPVPKMPHAEAPPDVWDFLKQRSPLEAIPAGSSTSPKPKEPAPLLNSVGGI